MREKVENGQAYATHCQAAKAHARQLPHSGEDRLAPANDGAPHHWSPNIRTELRQQFGATSYLIRKREAMTRCHK